MNENDLNIRRQNKLDELKNILKDVDRNLLSIAKDFKWDFQKLLNEKQLDTVTCLISNHHKVPASKIKFHEKKCHGYHKDYLNDNKPFSEHSGYGSHVTLNSELLESIIKRVPLSADKKQERTIPETSSSYDQNFSREEKLAIYDYVIANTEKQGSYSCLFLQPFEKKEQKKEMAAWEIAAAERDAKRRRASYRNKVHTNRKTYTEILREVIEVQMEAFLEENQVKTQRIESEKNNLEYKPKHKHKLVNKSRYSKEEKKHSDDELKYSDRDHKKKNHDRHSRRNDHFRKRSPLNAGSDYYSRSRSRDKHKKWKSYEGRSHSHKSSE